MNKRNKGTKKYTKSSSPIALVLLLVLLLSIISACQMFMPVAPPVTPEPPPARAHAQAPASELTPEPANEPAQEASPEPTPEPAPEIEEVKAKRTDYEVVINDTATSLLVYEIDEYIYVDLFELASELSNTDKRFFPYWDERHKILHLTSETAFTRNEQDSKQLTIDEMTVTPVDLFAFLDGNQVAVSAYSAGDNILINLQETADVMTLVICRELSENALDIFTNQTTADSITRLRSLDPSKPMVALTFDDGPLAFTPLVLDILEQHNVVATFYVIGRQIEKNIETMQRAHEMGNEIANHTWSHPSLERTSAETIRTQLMDTNAAIEAITGVPQTHMRPPYARINATVQEVTRELGLSIMFWSIDPSDYLPRTPERIYNDIMEKVQDRDIILLHDVHERSIEATKQLVPSLIRRGFQLVTVSELMYFSDITMEPGESYRHGRD